MEWTTKSIMICAFDMVSRLIYVVFIALFVVLNDKLFVCNEIELFIVDLFCLFDHFCSSSLKCICGLCGARAVFLRAAGAMCALHFTAAAGISAARSAKPGDRHAANWFLARSALGGFWRCS